MKKRRTRRTRRRGISRIDQPSTRTHGWFVRAGFYERGDGRYVPRYRRFFGDVTYGGKRAGLRAAKEYLAVVASAKPKAKSKAKKGTRGVRRAA